MMKRTAFLTTLIFLLLLVGGAWAMSSTNYRLDWFTPLTGGGGGTSSSASYGADLTIGQTALGQSYSAGYGLCLGYWCQAETSQGCVGLTDVLIQGPTSGYTDTLYTFSAVVAPTGATPPITYTWSPEPESGQGTASARYRWSALGDYNLSLAAGNCGGSDTDAHTITIQAGEQRYIYLPTVMRD